MSCIHPHIPFPNAPHMEQIQDDPPVQEKYFLVAPKRLVQPVQSRSLVQTSSVCHDENSILLVLININHLPVGKLNASFLVLDHMKIMAFQTFQMGKQIVIYYGSMMRLFGYLDDEGMRREIARVLRHELKHHIEGRAGIRSLEKWDEEQIAAYLQRGLCAERKREK